MHVHKIAEGLEMYANDVQPALNCEARGMKLGRAAPILVPLKLRLCAIFLRMHSLLLHYTKSYQPRGATCISELSEEQRLHWASTPAETVFVESHFVAITDPLSDSGPSVHPLSGPMVVAARHNDALDVSMLEANVGAIVAEALRLEADTGTHERRKLSLKMTSSMVRK